MCVTLVRQKYYLCCPYESASQIWNLTAYDYEIESEIMNSKHSDSRINELNRNLCVKMIQPNRVNIELTLV